MLESKKMPVEVYSRVVGYYRPVNQWNKGKRQEFNDRKESPIPVLMKRVSVCEH